MYLNVSLELSMVLTTDEFNDLFDRKAHNLEDIDEDKFIDRSMEEKGLLVTYRASQYKKKIKLTINPNVILGGDEPDKANSEKLIRKLEKRVESYFKGDYCLDHFNPNKLFIVTDIDVGSRDRAADYIKVLQRVGKIKGYSVPRKHWLDDKVGYCLEGNSNGTEFLIYDIERLLKAQAEESDFEDRELKPIIKKAEGVLRAEVRLVKSTAIRALVDSCSVTEQVAALCGKAREAFLNVFLRAVPFGDFHKKDKAVEIIKKEVKDETIRRRMLRLVDLIPEKRSMLLSQKAMDYRRMDEVMETFQRIDLAPVTLSKRHEIKRLDNLYKYM